MSLSTTDIARTAAQFCRDLRDSAGPFAFVKADLGEAVTAVDTWVDTNQTSFNAALPQPFKGAATSTQKALLLCYVVMRRVSKLRAEED